MRTFSASEAISPAINRTKAILFQPFRKGRSWKLAATAYLCRIGTMFFPFPLAYLFFLPAAKRAGGTAAAAAVAIGVTLFTAMAVYIFYLCSRLQFAYFDITLFRGEFVAPAWRKYGSKSSAWTAVKIAVGVIATFACALPIAAYIRHIIPLFHAMQSLKPGQPPPPEIMFAMFAGYGIIFLVFGPIFLISSLLGDFLIPLLALEDLRLKEAFARLMGMVRREPGQFALYTLLKILLGFAGYMGATLAWEIVFIFVTFIVVLVVGALGFLLHFIGVPTIILTVIAVLIGIAWYLFFLMYTLLITMGTVLTFFDAYALYFFAGRYPLLGDLLEASEPPQPAIYMPSPYPAVPYPPPPMG